MTEAQATLMQVEHVKCLEDSTKDRIKPDRAAWPDRLGSLTRTR
jgi:hypothetical protein